MLASGARSEPAVSTAIEAVAPAVAEAGVPEVLPAAEAVPEAEVAEGARDSASVILCDEDWR